MSEDLDIKTADHNSFIIQNKTGATVAYINGTGGMYLTGTLTESVGFG